VLAAKFKRPWVILSGILVATLLNHGLAAWAGGWISAVVSPQVLKYTLAFTFIGFAALLFLVFGIGILIGY
jgi:putative Ca2+/H+ antiporter (TMEM165/GDT1 family)